MLRWGFYLYESDKKKQREEKFNELNKTDKKVYHNLLPYMLLATDVHVITKKTIPIILQRLHYNRIIADEKEKKYFLNEKYLQKFIGYEVNVITLSDDDFFRRLKKNYQNNVGIKLTKKKIKEFETIKED